ncbi:MAG: LytTR family DNA-binding domain-containing protein [Alistipes sp.]
MKALIIEDEIPAQINLTKAIEKNFDDIEICGVFPSVKSAVCRLQDTENKPDLIFMDVELSDGMCFDIFDQVQVSAKVIITTAYDNYAIKAFKVNSIDYLLKPIEQEELRNAIERCRKAISTTEPDFDIEALRNALLPEGGKKYKKRFIIKLGDKIVVVNSNDVAYFYAEDKSTFLVTNDGKRHMLDQSLDATSEQIDPAVFFRISRNCTASIRAIGNISKHLSNRLKVNLIPKADFEVFVSRFRTTDFMNWLEDK